MPCLGERAAPCIQVPRITRPGPPPELLRVLWAALVAPLPAGCVGDDPATAKQPGCPSTVAEREAGVEPDGVAEARPRPPMLCRESGRGGGRHPSSPCRDGWMQSGRSSQEALRGWPENVMGGVRLGKGGAYVVNALPTHDIITPLI